MICWWLTLVFQFHVKNPSGFGPLLLPKDSSHCKYCFCASPHIGSSRFSRYLLIWFINTKGWKCCTSIFHTPMYAYSRTSGGLPQWPQQSSASSYLGEFPHGYGKSPPQVQVISPGLLQDCWDCYRITPGLLQDYSRINANQREASVSIGTPQLNN